MRIMFDPSRQASCTIHGPAYSWELTLQPGINDLTDAQAEQLASVVEHPVVKDMMTRGLLVHETEAERAPAAAPATVEAGEPEVTSTDALPAPAAPVVEKDAPAPTSPAKKLFGHKKK